MTEVPLPFALLGAVVTVSLVILQSKLARRRNYREQLRQWQDLYPDPRQRPTIPPPAPPPSSVWSTAGTVLAAVAAVGGLAILATAVLVFVVLSSGAFKFGNK